MTQFTANEVRELAKHMESVGWQPDSKGDPECYDEGAARSAEILFAFADMLEAREIARNDAIEREYERENNPATSDAERLAEALHSIGERLSSVLCDPFGEVVVRGPDDDRQIIAQALKDLGELAAHSVQAQPPAASVTDAMQELADKYHELLWAVARKFPGETRHETALRYIREAECQEAALAAQENPNG